MSNKGKDIGNGYTKYDGGQFASKIKFGEISSFGRKKANVHEVEYKGNKFIVGDGAGFNGDDRYFNDYYKLCLLTAIALEEKKEDFIETNVVVGVPIIKHKLIAPALKEHILSYGQQEITVDGKTYTIRINDCKVFIEGAYPILTEDESKILVIDMGRGTINVSVWNELAVEFADTFDDGLNKMYTEIATYLKLNKEGASKITASDIEKLLNKKTATIGNATVDISEIRHIVENNIMGIASDIKNACSWVTCDKIYVIGGGGADTFQYWKKHFTKAELVDKYQDINRQIYQKVADEEFGD